MMDANRTYAVIMSQNMYVKPSRCTPYHAVRQLYLNKIRKKF